MDRNNDRVIARSEWRGTDEEFRRYDVDGDGVLSGDEVRLDSPRDNFYEGVRQPDAAFGNWTAQRFDSLDRNRDGRIARKEWRLDREIFRLADRNGDNFLSRWEFQRAPDAIFESADTDSDDVITQDEWWWSQTSFDRRDLNHDGRITRNEWSAMAGGQRSGAVGTSQRPGVVGTSGSLNTAYNAGFERGMAEARAQAREDRIQNHGYDPEGQRELETADSGYETRFGPKADYQAGYRAGWRRGYPEGWRQP